jgi:hypothetical protein
VSIVVGAAACSTAKPSNEPRPPAGSPAAETSAGAPRQPYDILLGDQLGVIDYSQLKVRNKCLADAGFPQELRAMRSRPNNPISHLLVSARSFGPTSEAEARASGFGSALAAEPPVVVSFDKSFDAEMERCTRQANEQLGFDSVKILTAYQDLANQLGAYRSEIDRQLPKDLPEKLLSCMDDEGYRADRTRFLQTPDPALFGVQLGRNENAPGENWRPRRRPGTVQVGPALPARRYTPTAEESELAVAWLRCRKSTRLAEHQLEAAYAAQQRYVERFETQIAELNGQVTAMARKAAAVAQL